MELSIEHNKALELIFAIFKYYTYCFRKDDTFKIIIPSKQIISWIQNVNKEISPFLKSDLMVLCGKYPAYTNFFDTYLDIIYANKITEAESLIEHIREMPEEELVRKVYKYSEIDISFDSDCETIFDKVRDAYDSETANLFVHAKRFPSGYKSRVVSLFDKFNTFFVKPNEEYISSFIEEKLRQHNHMIKCDTIAFINTIGIGDYSKVIRNAGTIRIFISYYFDYGIFYGEILDNLLIMYGYYMGERFNQQVMQDKYKNLFKALSDERRLEITRLTSKRPWYNKELADYFDLTPATLSYHLNFLLELGILNFEPSNYNRYYYTTNKETLKAVFEYAYKDLTEAP